MPFSHRSRSARSNAVRTAFFMAAGRVTRDARGGTSSHSSRLRRSAGRYTSTPIRMRLRGLHCRLSTSDPEHLETISWSGTPHDLADVRAGGVYLVGDGALETLRRFTDIVNDRGAKHDRRALSAILLRQPRVPLARADFRTLGSLRKSVGTLLRNARECGEDKAYVIGLPAARLQEIAARIGVTAERSGADADTDTPDLLLLDPVEVPRALEEQVIGESREMHIVRQWIVRAAGHDEPVLILGETGTG